MAENEIVPIPVPDALALANPTQLKQRLEDYSASRELFIRWVADQLKPGIDYMVIHRKSFGKDCPQKDSNTMGQCPKCKAKATMLKPGAEKVCALLKLTPRFRKDIETWEMLGQPAGTIALVCELFTTDGTIVGEGRGIRSIEQDGGDANKTIKMVEKSGHIDATLRTGGLSELCTLDLDDMNPQTVAQQATTEFPRLRTVPLPESSGQRRDTTPAGASSVGASTRGAAISEAQHRSLESALNSFDRLWGYAAETCRQRMKDRIGQQFSKEHFPDLTAEELKQVYDWLTQDTANERARKVGTS